MSPVAGAEPYPWPWDGDLDLAGTALVVAGAQRAWIERCDPGGTVIATIAKVAAVLRAAGSPVVLLRHAAASARQEWVGLPPAAGTAGWALGIESFRGDTVVDARGVNGFHGGPLDDLLRTWGTSRLVMCGFGLEATVDSTTRSANDRGYECLVLTDAVACFDPDLGAHALASVTMSGGIFGAIATSTDLLDALP